jgi:hypothetical protein
MLSLSFPILTFSAFRTFELYFFPNFLQATLCVYCSWCV